MHQQTSLSFITLALPIILLIVFFLSSCAMQVDSAQESMRADNSAIVNKNPSTLSGGGSGTVVHTGTGVVVSKDVDNKLATIMMDDGRQLYAGSEITFNFKKHTQYLPVEIELANIGDRVKVRYFDSCYENGNYYGESLEILND